MAFGMRSRVILENLATTALITAIGSAAIYISSLKYLIALLWAVPVLFLVRKHDLYKGLGAVLISALVLTAMSQRASYLVFVFQFTPVIIIVALLFKKDISAGKGLFIVLLAGLIINGTLIFATLNSTARDIANWQKEMQINVDETMRAFEAGNALQYYESIGITREQVREALVYDNLLIRQMIYLVPGILTIGYLITVAVIYFIAHLILRGKRAAVPNFACWQMPWQANLIFAAGLGTVLLGDYLGITALAVAGLNILLVISPFVLIFGLAIAYFFYRKWKPGFLGILLLVLFFLSGTVIFLSIIALLGIFDPYVDFRSLNRNKGSISGG